MATAEQKVAQYLGEAHAMERASARLIEAQIAMTPRGTLRTALERHHDETQTHADRVAARLSELDGASRNPVRILFGFSEAAIAQAAALAKTPFDLVRGSGGEEKVLKNAKDACANEALEIATYTALERLARDVDDDQTADLAASIREEEERMLDALRDDLPDLTDAVVRADVKGKSSFDVSKTGAADAARKTATKAKRATAKRARKVPGAARTEGRVRGAVASAGDLPISRYDDLAATEITTRLRELSQVDLAKVEAYERRNESRTTVLERVSTLQADEPWAGYDELNVAEVKKALAGADDERVRSVRSYERAHKERPGVLDATERETAST